MPEECVSCTGDLTQLPSVSDLQPCLEVTQQPIGIPNTYQLGQASESDDADDNNSNEHLFQLEMTSQRFIEEKIEIKLLTSDNYLNCTLLLFLVLLSLLRLLAWLFNMCLVIWTLLSA